MKGFVYYNFSWKGSKISIYKLRISLCSHVKNIVWLLYQKMSFLVELMSRGEILLHIDGCCSMT